jgi:hypothetical protein
MLRKVVVRAGGAFVVGAGGAVAYAQTDPGFERQTRFWLRAGPIVASYGFHKKRMDFQNVEGEERKKEYERLHDIHAPQALELILALKGLCKLAPLHMTRALY